jgi:competence protein ComEC
MHVGLIFWLINLVLKYFDKKKYQRIIKAIISLVIIWAYSLLCGLSPSILRASVMFSFVALGNMVKNKPNIYNTLAASAFTLMLFDSNILANVGFQLSFLAVFGIVSLQKYINKWLVFDHKVSKWFWGIISVSIAAQMATFPIGLLYFHQFPVYFLVSNLIIIPITTGIIFIAIGLIIAAALIPLGSWFGLLATFLGILVKWLISITNYIVVWLEKLPFSYITGIHITEIETIILFIAIAYFCNYFITRKQYLAKNALIGFICFFSIYGFRYFQILNQKSITVYNINKTFAMQIMNGTKSTLIADSALLCNPDKIRFHIQQHIWASGIKKVDTILLRENSIIQLPDEKINISNLIVPNFTNILTGKPSWKNTPIPTNTKVIASSKINKTGLEKLKSNHFLLTNVQEIGAITVNIEP